MNDVRKDAENWGDALNDASWAMIEAYRKHTGKVETPLLFNFSKSILRDAILVYLDKTTKDKMIKVIGKDPKAVKTITCQHCASILEYVDADTKRYDGRDYSDGSDGKIWIDCPYCENKVVIESW